VISKKISILKGKKLLCTYVCKNCKKQVIYKKKYQHSLREKRLCEYVRKNCKKALRITKKDVSEKSLNFLQ
jgi:hypothetical protein